LHWVCPDAITESSYVRPSHKTKSPTQVEKPNHCRAVDQLSKNNPSILDQQHKIKPTKRESLGLEKPSQSQSNPFDRLIKVSRKAHKNIKLTDQLNPPQKKQTTKSTMRFNTPISSISKDEQLSKTITMYSFMGTAGGGVDSTVSSTVLKPSANDMKDTTTVRINNPKFRTHNVKATDNFSAPVAKLQMWLASDPTKPKKEYLTVRKGNNVIAKSNKFEKQTMAIGTKAKMLQDVAEKTIVTSNRKQFEKDGNTRHKEGGVAHPVVEVIQEEPLYEPSIDGITGEQNLEESQPEVETTPLPSFEEYIMEEVEQDNTDGNGNKASPSFEEKKTFAEALAEFQVDEDVPKLMTSVELRKQKLEAMEHEARRRANNPYGMLQPSWGRPNPNRGLPSDAWNRTLKGTPPPKKTFAELP
jgi:hypothetical protein